MESRRAPALTQAWSGNCMLLQELCTSSPSFGIDKNASCRRGSEVVSRMYQESRTYRLRSGQETPRLTRQNRVPPAIIRSKRQVCLDTCESMIFSKGSPATKYLTRGIRFTKETHTVAVAKSIDVLEIHETTSITDETKHLFRKADKWNEGWM